MPFHYLRTPWEHGGVAREDGAPPGTRLDRILAMGLPPRRIGLELTAALCEILYIAHEDGEAHGDVRLTDVWLTGDGVVALGGFDPGRTTTSAPERTPKGGETDLYGLGRVATSLLCHTAPALARLPVDGAPVHDDAVVELVMGADLDDLDEAMANDVRWFLIYLLSFDRKDRPDALRAWQSFIAFARTVQGPALAPWALDAVRGAAQVPTPAQDAPEAPPAARGSAGPLAAAMSFSSTAASKTLYWSRSELLEDAKVAEPERGGGQTTSHWSRADLIAMAQGQDTAPRPHRAQPVPPAEPAPTSPPPPPAVATMQPAEAAPAPPPPPVPSSQVPIATFHPDAPAAPAQPRAVRWSTSMLVFLGASVTLFLLAVLVFVAAIVLYLSRMGAT